MQSNESCIAFCRSNFLNSYSQIDKQTFPSTTTMPENKEIEKASSDPVAIAIEKAKPIISKVSFSSLLGFCSGYAVKQVGKIAVVVIGAGYIAVQTCVSYGYIHVDWGKVKDDAIKKVDVDGDGKLGADDMKIYWTKLKSLLTANLPNSGGFSLGFLYGIKQ